ncbi:MAG: alanine--tRNA ligase [Deltaproteobacteria bacterium]|nr:MAG: alanine--tRNA ligase [Deltaproteobacteria bacterium]
MKASDIRTKFSEFFISKGHEKIDSSPLIPQNDPTLLFANAGMNQFKDYFTGAAKAANPRAVTVQKCVRAGGKHNDLENVGFTARHHTFFEMLGNFSFGDYFKKEAISYAWEFLTKELGIDKDKLYVTVHESDQEAADIWHQQEGVPRERIFFLGDKDNFWEMGDTGPCGPCSEIFYDHGPEHSDPNADTSKLILNDEVRYVEIWNLVFMQFEKYMEDGQIKRRSLPKPSVDTGAGLERIAAAMTGNYNNYETLLFQPIIQELSRMSGKKYENHLANMRIVADHVRAATMLITDGVIPSNEGRGYVLRRIIRRGVRQLEELGLTEPSMHKLIPQVWEILGEEYPENMRNSSLAEKYIMLEEENFRRTLSTGLDLLNKELKGLKGDTLSGEIAFKLYDTYGFPMDLTEVILREKNLKLDTDGFEKCMEEQKERSRKASDFSASGENQKVFYDLKDKFGETEFLGYKSLTAEVKLLAKEKIGEYYALIFDKTPFYGEGGGQAGDSGEILGGDSIIANILDTQKPVDGLFVHYSKDADGLNVDHHYTLKVNAHQRNLTARNHTATHLLQAALIEVLGDHIKQAGSAVAQDRLRFDFTHPEAVKKSELRKVERIVNEQILKGTDVCAEVMSKDKAMQKGAMALFGEKYGDEVRVIDIPGFSVEFCGGTHVSNTSEIGLFSIISESSLSAGVRRIEAVASNGAFDRVSKRMETLDNLEATLKVKGDDVVGRVEQFMKDLKDKQKEIDELKEKLQAQASGDLFANPESLKGDMVFKAVNAPDGSDLRKLGDLFIDKNPKGVVLITSVKGDKASVFLKTFKGNKDINCSNILKDVLDANGGRGGGKPDMAQGSVDPDKISAVETMVRENLQ